MGFKFRKSIKIGPTRINLSKSGVGYSVGVKGARVTKTAKGQTRTTLSIPGTGISYSKTKGKEKTHSDHSETVTNTKKTAFNSATSSMPAKAAEKSWLMAVIMAIIAFPITLIASFIVVLIILLILSIAGVSLFKGTVAKITLTYVPLVLAALSSVIAFKYSKPEKATSNDTPQVADNTNNDATVIDIRTTTPDPHNAHTAASTPVSAIVEDTSKTFCLFRKKATEPEVSDVAQRLAEAHEQFDAELQSIPLVNVELSHPAPRQLLKDMPPYSFSNITRKTRLDSIFPLVILDVETTGLYPSKHEILEVAAIKFDHGMIPVEAFTSFCKPKRPIADEITQINSITNDTVADAPAFSEIASALTDFINGCHVAGHNLDFDLRFIFAHGADLPEGKRFYDTLDLAHLTIPENHVYDYKLDTLCSYYGIWRKKSHRALSDCYATSKILSHLVFDKTSRRLDARDEALTNTD